MQPSKKELVVFITEEALKNFLHNNPESMDEGVVQLKNFYQPKDMGNLEYFSYERLLLDFPPFDHFDVLKDPKNHTLYLGDINLGGHVGNFRIAKIKREDLFQNQEELSSWYDNFAEKMWR